MQCIVVVSSASGNTQLVADAVVERLERAGAAVLAVVDPGAALEDPSLVAAADIVFAGFWTDKGDCAPEMAEFLGKLAGKRVFLFGTAGFGGDAAYFDRITANIARHLPEGAELVGTKMCQGKMGAGVRARYEAMLVERPGDARVQGMIENFDAALAHPTQEDLGQVADAAAKALSAVPSAER